MLGLDYHSRASVRRNALIFAFVRALDRIVLFP